MDAEVYIATGGFLAQMLMSLLSSNCLYTSAPMSQLHHFKTKVAMVRILRRSSTHLEYYLSIHDNICTSYDKFWFKLCIRNRILRKWNDFYIIYQII